MNTQFQGILTLVGRILIALFFVPSGWGKISGGFAGTVAYATQAGLPMPTVGVAIATAIELIAGIALLVGFQTRWAAAALALFTFVAAFFFHNYWAMPAEMQMIQSILFWIHLALVGGLLSFVAHGAGCLSLDARCIRKAA